MANNYCDRLGIDVPDLATVKDRPDASPYSLLIVALLERGEAMTLAEVAERFATAGVAPADTALASLKRCRPARAPIYRIGDRYELDAHDDKLDLWAFRLGLRPARAPSLSIVRPEPEPPPGPEVPLSVDELDEAFADSSLYAWSTRRLALAVLDANGAPMTPEAVVDAIARRTRWHTFRVDSAQFDRRGSPVRVCDDGRWEIAGAADALLFACRKAVRERILVVRKRALHRPDPVVQAAQIEASRRRRAARGAALMRLRRVLVHAFPADAPELLVLVDVESRQLETFAGAALETARARLGSFEVIGAIDVRVVLRALDFDPGDRRLAELGPPQKTIRLDGGGRTLPITSAMLVQGSCGISTPFGDPRKLRSYLRDGQTVRLRRRLEADARSLLALYTYGRLHGCVRLRWGHLDEMLPVPWVSWDEPTLYGMVRTAHESGRWLEVVTGDAPRGPDPWERARTCRVYDLSGGRELALVDAEGYEIERREVQLARWLDGAD